MLYLKIYGNLAYIKLLFMCEHLGVLSNSVRVYFEFGYIFSDNKEHSAYANDFPINVLRHTRFPPAQPCGYIFSHLYI